MKTSLLCLLLVGLAPLAESRAPRPAEFKGTDATFAALTDALGKPKSQFPEFLRSGESLPMGKLMRSRTGNWWAVIAETGVFELYQLGHDGAFYGPLAPMPSGPWLNTPVMNKVFKLSQCHLDMRANGNLVMAYEHAMGARTQKSEFLVKAGPKAGCWLMLTDNNPPRVELVDPESPGMKRYFQAYPDSRPQGPLATPAKSK